MRNADAEPGHLPPRRQGAAAGLRRDRRAGLGAVGDLPLAHPLRGLSERDRHPKLASTPTRATSWCRSPIATHPVMRSFFITDGEVTEEELTIDMTPHADVQRGPGAAVRAPHHPAQHRRRRSAQAARQLGARDRRRWSRLADRDVPGGRRHRQARHRRLRRGRRLEPAAPDPAHERRHRPPEGRERGRAPARDQPDDRGRRPRHAAVLDERLRRVRRLRRRRRRHRQLPRALPRERRDAVHSASRSCTARSISSRARRPCSCRVRRRRATGACSRRRRLRARCRAAPRAACSACCPA